MGELSSHFKSRNPSAIRLAQIEYAKRTDNVGVVNTAIGNVSLPMHPAMQKRMFNLNSENSPFRGGVVKYTATIGLEETNKAFLNIISSSGFDTQKLFSQITDGGSQSMELVIIGCCGRPGTSEKPLLLIDAAYTNYKAMASRLGRTTVSIVRNLDEQGKFSLPDIEKIESVIQEFKPGALVVIPYDNPTGQFYDLEIFKKLAELCVKHNMWLISDEAYRELHYVKHDTVSVWGITNKEVPGIEGRRISIETTSKVWNACGLRIGALITDNIEFHQKAIAENTASLCSNSIGQYIAGALAHVPHNELNEWYEKQRAYYFSMMKQMTQEFKNLMPDIIISNPEASIYSVIDVRKMVDDDFDSLDFVKYCATKGKVEMDGEFVTLLVSPMGGFYSIKSGEPNPGKTQMRIAYVASPAEMAKVPMLFKELFNQYLNLNND